MRVIQTQFLFDRKQVDVGVDLDPPDYPAVACAWFKIDRDAKPSIPEGISGKIFAFERGGFAPLFENPSEERIAAFLDTCLYDLPYDGVNNFAQVNNPRLVEYILQQSIILEESPPKAVPLKSFIGPGSIISVGTFLGYGIAPGSYPILMLITVPAGIIVVGSAAGIAVGLHHGLSELVKKKFVEWTKKPRQR